MTELTHERMMIYKNAYNCEHPEPPKPEGVNDHGDPAWVTWDDYCNDHPISPDTRERFCLLAPVGSACPACTDIARDDEDLPVDEYVECRLEPADA